MGQMVRLAFLLMSLRWDLARLGWVWPLMNLQGIFLSLAFAAPDAAVQGMTKFTLFQCDMMTVVDHQVIFHLRLNVQYAATVATFTQAVKTSGGHVCATFDLGFHRFEVGEFSKIWLDVMIDSPQHNRIIVNDLTLLRHPWGQF